MFLTVDEVAEKLQLNPETIRRYIIAKELEAYKFGKKYRVEEKELERFLKVRSNIERK